MWASDLYLALLSFRLRAVNRVAPLALIVGTAFAFIGQGIFGLTVPGTLLNTIIMDGIAVHGIGWILFGLIVALRRRPAPPAARA